MTIDKHSEDLATDRARELAKEKVGNRLALISAVIWLTIVSVLYVFVWLPQDVRGSEATRWAALLLVVAALPWLAYRPWVRSETRRQLNEQPTES